MFWNNTTYPSLDSDAIPAQSYFTVGVDNNNMTVLKIHNGNHTTTLTMNEHSTQTLIKLLATATDTVNK
jgi:hypothetical protein